MANTESQRDGAPLLGDHLALDLLNTEARKDGVPIDYWTSGTDVLSWLADQGIVPASAPDAAGLAALLERGRALRALARRLVARRKDGAADVAREDIDALNGYLHAHLSAPHLGHDDEGRLALSRRAQGDAVGALLGPVAQALAQLLAEGDFDLVRQCEHPDCVLWFYDRTKSHKRRWCSMALCGNRHKAAQFRKRSGGAAA